MNETLDQNEHWKATDPKTRRKLSYECLACGNVHKYPVHPSDGGTSIECLCNRCGRYTVHRATQSLGDNDPETVMQEYGYVYKYEPDMGLYDLADKYGIPNG